MILPRREDAKHKNQLFRLLREVLGNKKLANNLMFKGGTYAALLGVLDRFSIDLDFDMPDITALDTVREECHKIFKKLDLEVKDESKNHLQFFLRYPAPVNERNTLKLEINDTPSKFNVYESKNLLEINMYCKGHSLDTMFANKFVAAKARYDKTGKIAGRDFYDLHKFFEQGFSVNTKVIKDLTGMSYTQYLHVMKDFILKNVTRQVLLEDLNPLLRPEEFKRITPILIDELLMYISDDIRREDEVK
ncbi:MAG: hypothetical protein ACD_22C00009G0008 [uncultured bacterium]|uniref:Nucleotidyl transferase AbiEii/AbiGii toxin family protein n=1 Tax=candidate division WWE3 bacterium RBG_16_37_10 TaxID=1802610 RepID=A0A1F4V2V5_UNCKA|nr:MAG: hypothetical protein ACD_22C00009G0008 [uncultured bacterium]OGC51492.1 MAG: hypothetical protein A2W32_02525 [candidate division WWE3 bacterium RBG_16_37_10]